MRRSSGRNLLINIILFKKLKRKLDKVATDTGSCDIDIASQQNFW